MSRRCELTGVGPMVGNNVSHSNVKTKRRFLPSLTELSLQSEGLGQSFRQKWKRLFQAKADRLVGDYCKLVGAVRQRVLETAAARGRVAHMRPLESAITVPEVAADHFPLTRLAVTWMGEREGQEGLHFDNAVERGK